jgi:uncharacterized protein YndB with AHSA1/START domain
MQNERSSDQVELVRRLKTQPAIVFAAFADPMLVSSWLKPSRGIRLEVLDYDFCVGGEYRFAYHVPDLPVMRVSGQFRLIDAPHSIAFSWNIEPPDVHAGIQSQVHVGIRAAGTGSEIDIRHTKLVKPGAPQRHAEGWDGALTLLEQLLEDVAHGT